MKVIINVIETVFEIYEKCFLVDVYLNIESMKLKDNFGSDTSLVFSGRNLTFNCEYHPDCAKMTVKHHTSTWAADEPTTKHKVPGGLNSSTEFGEYVCSATNKFALNYLLCKH